MTVSSETNKSGPYSGNGVTTVFAYGFRILDATHLRVVSTQAGAETTVSPSAYTVSGVGSPSGGNVTFTTAPVSGVTITILRDVPFVQETDLENQGAFFAEVVEDAFDAAAMRDQQLKEELGRALQLPVAVGSGVSPEVPAPEANKVLGWSNDAARLQNLDVTDFATIIVATGTANVDTFTGDGVTVDFALSENPGTLANLDVSVNGATLVPGVDYTWISGVTLTFTVAPAVADEILVRYTRGLPQGITEADLVQTDQGPNLQILLDLKHRPVADLLANTTLTYGNVTAGLEFEAGGFRYEVAASGASDQHVTTAGGVKLYVLPGGSSSYNVKAFGAVGDGIADDTAKIQAALNTGSGATVYIPKGTYLVSSLTALTETIICGDGRGSVLKASGTGNILVINGVSGGTQIEDVTVRDLSFLGLNNMTTGPLGCGVISSHSINTVVENCYFDSFGPGAADTSSGGAAICFYVGCIGPVARGNTVVNGTGYLNGVDIAVYSAGGDAIIDGNKCYSVNSNGIYTNAATKTGRIIITNNICKNHTRHGIIPVYGGTGGGVGDTTGDLVDTIVANNICENCDSTGIYVNTNADGMVIANNIIESCSGGGPNGYTLDGGISLLGTGNKIVTGNFIRNTGYTSAGVQRVINTSGVANDPTRTAGIRVSNSVAGIVSGNVIVGGSGRGIDLANGAAGVQIVDNTITNPEYAAIHISALNNAGANSIIARNKIDVSISDAMGIWHRGSAAADQCFIEENRIKGKKAATAKDGIRFEGNGITGSVSRNDIGSFDVGLNLQSTLMSTRLGDTCVFDGNQIHDNTEGFRFLSDLTDFGFYRNFVFANNGTNTVDQFGRNTVRPAVSVSPHKLFYRSAEPTVGTWAVGDRVINTAPTVGQPKSWVCTVAGTPGTWVSEGNL